MNSLPPVGPSADVLTTPTFDVSSVGELLGQLVGACSVTRFWDAMPAGYPSAAGVFRDRQAGVLVDAAMDAYRRMGGEDIDEVDAPTEGTGRR